MISQSNSSESVPITVFISYSHKDEDFREELDIHLSNLKRQSKIQAWNDRAIEAGEEWEAEIRHQLETAQLILLLISPRFMASNYCYDKEMQKAIERHNKGLARVIPIIVKPADWENTPFSKLQVLPKDAKPITTWNDRDEAFLDVVKGIRRAVESLSQDRPKTRAVSAGSFSVSKEQHSQKLKEEAEVDVQRILPEPFEWCYVPEGEVKMPVGWDDDATTEIRNISEGFYISKYPITYEQYYKFACSSKGYINETWWEGLHGYPDLRHEHTQKRKGVDLLVPAIVTRYDAIAFCRWLSNELLRTIVVPSEAHWLRSAQGDDNRKYPWGNFFDPLKCNSGVSEFGRLTPVTRYQNGASPYGVCDLSGNYCEWCVLSNYESKDSLPDPEPGVEYSETVKRYYRNLYGYYSADFHPRQTTYEDVNLDHFCCAYRGDSVCPGPYTLASFRICLPSVSRGTFH